jgi:peptidoglycan/LPS O-acetylase OafA/YrhL
MAVRYSGQNEACAIWMSAEVESSQPPLDGPAGAGSAGLAFLDGMRGLAALYVVIGHARWLLWEGYSEGYKRHPDHYGVMGKVLVEIAAAFKWGHEAVIFFFVLSGFVIHLRYARRIATEGAAARFDLGTYLLRRSRRLYPPLALAMLITLGLDLLGQHLQLPTASGTTIYKLINANVGTDHRATTALRNLAFIMVPVFGSDGPLWSLGYEGYFYLLYPLVFLLARRSLWGATLMIVALSAVGIAPLWPRQLVWLRGVCQLMVVWWLGALLASRFIGAWRARYQSLAWLSLALLAVPIQYSDPVVRDIVIGFGFVGLLSACFARLESGRPSRWLALIVRVRPLGGMSYTLYVLHFPILVFMSGCLMKRSGGPLPEHFAWSLAGVLVSTSIAYGFHFVVERPFTSRTAPREIAPRAA